MTSTSRVGALATALAAVVAAATAVATAGPAGAATGRPVVSMTVTSAKTVSMAHTAHPGRAHLRAAGAHSVYVYRLRHGNLDTFVRDVNSSSPNPLERDFFAVDHVQAHSDVWASLPRGTYYVVDGDVFPIKKAWVSALKVSGTTINAPVPSRAYAVTVNAHDGLSVPSTLSTSRPIRLALASSHDQVVWLFHVGHTVSEKTIADFVAHPSPKKYGELHATSQIELAGLDAPQTVWTSWRAASGRYVIFNLAYDKAGKLYFAHGQAHRLSVT